MRRSLSATAALLLLLATSPAGATPPNGFGNQWVRDHPFTLMGLNIFAANLEVSEYNGAGFTTLLAWEEIGQQTATAAAGGLTWYAHIRPADQGPDAFLQNLVASAAVNAGGLGWLLHDEPSYLQMSGIGSAAQWIRQSYPGTPVFGNAFPSYASPAQLYGDGSNPGYTFSAYLDDFISIIDPDILMYDHYPFQADGGTTDGFFSDLMMVRAKALAANIPYWAFIQSWANAGSRLPSESDLMMQIFAHLAAGYSGLCYFTYDHWDDGGLLDPAGAPTALYHTAADVNAEVLNLAQSLRYLTSVDVRYLQGEYLLFGFILTDNPVPSGMTAWSSGAGGDPHILHADVDSSDPATYGEGNDGLMGFFVDDLGRRYLMLVNLSHGAGLDAAAASLPLYVQFDSSTSELLELDPETGQQVLVPLVSNRLDVTLRGGSGRLFKYNDGPFAPDEGPGPDAGVDAGPPGPDASGNDSTAPPPDGTTSDDAGDAGGHLRPDGSASADAGDSEAHAQQGCACRSGGSGPMGSILVPLLLLLLLRRGARSRRID